MLGTGLIVAYGYSMEAFFAWYSGDKYESFMYWNRMTGPYGFTLCAADPVQHCPAAGAVVAQSPPQHLLVWIISIIVNIGMWLERFVIVVTSLHRDFLPSSWGMYIPHQMGLGDLRRHARFLHVPDLPVRAGAAVDLDL